MRRTGPVLSIVAFCLVALASSSQAGEYVVRSGDTLSKIAARYNTTVGTLKALNSLSGDLILRGQRLMVPAGSQPTLVHAVVGGDTLNALSKRYGTTVSSIQRANGLITTLIVVGQRLRIPIVASTSPATAPSTATPSSAFANGASSTLTGKHWAVRKVPRMSATANELEVLARIVKGECPPQTPREGKVAVAAVVLNRVRSKRFPNTIIGVAHQRSQFSSYNSDKRARLYWGKVPAWAYDAARAALKGEDPTGDSTYYFNPYLVKPSWAKRLQFVRKIENTRSAAMRRFTGHSFYRFKGTPIGIATLVGTTHN
jgi:LysM repeat protein